VTDELRCPRCRTDLATVAASGWEMYRCPGCDGVAVTMALLRKFAPRNRVNELWFQLADGTPGDPCPSCARPMTGTRVACEGLAVDLDGCRTCQTIWFDADELARFSPDRREPPPRADANADLSPRARAAVARATVEAETLGTRAQTQAAAVIAILVAIVRILTILVR
jgi:Zn-finger nucleic acid-binding protein